MALALEVSDGAAYAGVFCEAIEGAGEEGEGGVFGLIMSCCCGKAGLQPDSCQLRRQLSIEVELVAVQLREHVA